MFDRSRIKIDEIISVNHLVGNPKGSHTEFKTEKMFYYQLLFKLKGEAVITFGDKTIRECADYVRFLPSRADFDFAPFYGADVIEEGESINIAFTTFTPMPKEIIAKKYSSHSYLHELFAKIQKLWYYKREGYYHKSLAVLYEIFAAIEEGEKKYLSTRSYDLIAPAVDYISNHFAENDIDCKSLAALCGISQVYMNKIFKDQFGVSPVNYIISKKLDYACDLLRTNHYSMSEIAEMCGFSSAYYFSRIFKSHKGVPPTRYV